MNDFDASFDRPNEEQDISAKRLNKQVTTLGEQLAREAQRIAQRRMPSFPWLTPLEITMKQVSVLPVPAQARFQRVEASLPALNSSQLEQPSEVWSMPSLEQRLPMIREREDSRWAQPRHSLQDQDVKSVLAPPETIAYLEREQRAVREEHAQAQGQPLPPLVQQRLQEFVGPGAEYVRVHTDGVADAVAREQRADAVTVGQHVFFRRDRLRPDESEGFALLTHEATHVIQAMRPNAAWRRATQGGVQEEEHEANVLERKALEVRRSGELRPIRSSSRYTMQETYMPKRAPMSMRSPGVSSPIARPMTAAEDRLAEQAAAPGPVLPDMEEMRRTVYNDLMRKIRTDLERGG